jgi:hypothetical protein
MEILSRARYIAFTVGGGQRGGEDRYGPIVIVEPVEVHGEEAKHWGFLVVGPEAAEELGLGEEGAPGLADEGRAGEGRRKWWEAEQDLKEEVVVVRQ